MEKSTNGYCDYRTIQADIRAQEQGSIRQYNRLKHYAYTVIGQEGRSRATVSRRGRSWNTVGGGGRSAVGHPRYEVGRQIFSSAVDDELLVCADIGDDLELISDIFRALP